MSTVRSTTERHDLRVLESEVAIARSVLDFGAGTFGHSISLPAEEAIATAHRAHRNNQPYADALGLCPTLRGIFDSFRAEKTAFRLLRREAGTAYSLHDDRDKGKGIVRLQLPIVTNPSALLAVQKEAIELEPLARKVAEFADAEAAGKSFDYPRLNQIFGEWLDLFYLKPGRFYYFDTDGVHTLINAGNADRVTLCVDLVRTNWLEGWMSDQLGEEIAPLAHDKLPPGRWNWTALKHGLLSHPRVELA